MTKLIGVLFGLAVGFALAFGSFGQMLIVALFGAIGYGVAKVVAREVDLRPYVQGRRSNP